MDLTKYRKQIDEQDDIIIEALKKRFDIVQQIKEIKNQHTSSPINLHFNIKREYQMMQDLINKTNLPPETIYSIWRTLICSANKMEQKIDIIYNSKDAHIEICKEYPIFYDVKPTHNIVEAMLNPVNAVMGVFSLNENWWYDIFVATQNLRIFKIINNHAFVGYINDDVLIDEYAIFIVPTDNLTPDLKLISQHKDMSLVATNNKNLPYEIVGFVPSLINYGSIL